MDKVIWVATAFGRHFNQDEDLGTYDGAQTAIVAANKRFPISLPLADRETAWQNKADPNTGRQAWERLTANGDYLITITGHVTKLE